jgi:hypothetical protein
MEESLPVPQEEKSASRLFTNAIGALLVLLCLATAIRGWLICHTEVTSRDSIGYERYAWELAHDDWKHVLRSNVHHALYPLTILLISRPVRLVVSGSDLVVMQLSAQIASGLAGTLLVFPMFYLGKELFSRRVGFWAAAIFQCLPVGARVMSDALSESLFLLTSTTALVCAVRAFRTGSVRQFALCGLCAGLAYLTRPEGISIVAAVGLVLLGRLTLVGGQYSWRQTAYCLTGLVVGCAVVAGPYMAIIQGFSNKTTTQDVLRTAEIIRTPSFGTMSLGRGTDFQSVPPLAVVGVWWPDGKTSDSLGHLGWSLCALHCEIGKGFFYVGWVPALLGLFMFRARGPANSGRLVLIVLCLLQCLALLRVGLVAGYVADRHVLIIVLCGMYWAVAAVFFLIEYVQAQTDLFSRLCPSAACLFFALVAVALPKTLAPLHANRAGHHAVGLWLAEHITPADELDDPFCWAAHYAGRTFCRDVGCPVACAPGSEEQEAETPRFRYVVHECRPDHRERFRKPTTPVADLVAAGGKVVYHWPEGMPLEEASIILFAVPLVSNSELPQLSQNTIKPVQSD